MSRQYNDNVSPSVGGPSCSYSRLSNYNNSSNMGVAVPTGTVTGVYVVPTYGAPGYNTLTHDSSVPSCSGYFNINSAYGGGANDCNQQYAKRLCQ